MKLSEAGKGDRRRCSLVSGEEADLRWELWQSTTTSSRKKEIIEKLKKLNKRDL